MRGTIVFDLDGTLAETAPDIMGTLNHLLVLEGLAPLPLESARSLIGAGARGLIERGFREAGRTLEQAHRDVLFHAFLKHYLENVAVHSFLYPGLVTALDTLEAEGFRFAVCTNKPEPHAVALIAALGEAKRFGFVAGRDTFPFCKPDPRHISETVRRAGGDPARAIMVGDSRTDVDAARAGGIPVIGVTFGYTNVPMAELGPDIVIEHFDALVPAVRRLLPA